jgi:general secretion pathway protein G
MTAESPEKEICAGCGATLAPHLRYCVNCYRPVAGAAPARAHVETARRVETTRRADPTLVFRPDIYEARLRRARRLKRTVIISVAIVVLLAIAGVATWLLVPRPSTEQRQQAVRGAMARRELNMMAEALERFHEDVGRYPTSAENLNGLIHRPAAFKPTDDQRVNQWLGPYLDSLPEVDPWGNDYVYEVTDDGQSFSLYSHGPGGESGAGSQFEVTSPR